MHTTTGKSESTFENWLGVEVTAVKGMISHLFLAAPMHEQITLRRPQEAFSARLEVWEPTIFLKCFPDIWESFGMPKSSLDK
jgi:hypothetical protein